MSIIRIDCLCTGLTTKEPLTHLSLVFVWLFSNVQKRSLQVFTWNLETCPSQQRGGSNFKVEKTCLLLIHIKEKQTKRRHRWYRRIISILVKAGCQALIEIYNPELDLVAANKSVYRYLASLGWNFSRSWSRTVAGDGLGNRMDMVIPSSLELYRICSTRQWPIFGETSVFLRL